MFMSEGPVRALDPNWDQCLNLGGEGEGNLGVIVVRVCEPEFRNLPHSYTWPLKKWTLSYT